MEDQITSVEWNKGRAKLCINEEEYLVISGALYREAKLHKGMTFSLENFKAWLLPRQCQEALHSAVTYLSHSDRSRGEIRKKLSTRFYNDEVIDFVLYKLEKERLINDEAYALAYAQSRLRTQHGRIQIKQALRMKGIDSSLIEAVMEQLPEEAGHSEATLLAKKLLRRYADDEPRKAYQKMLGAMARRGYSLSEAKKAITAASED